MGMIFKLLQRAPVIGRGRCLVEFLPDALFETDVFESYWGPTLIGGRAYEPELWHILTRIKDLDCCLLDCGANVGFWTVLATSPAIGFRHAVAIEANPKTFEKLVRHRTLNGERFDCLLRAVADTDGATVFLEHADHHAVSRVGTSKVSGFFAPRASDKSKPAIETVTLDSVIDRMGWWERSHFVIKLDVEGHEPAALAGARKLRAQKDHLLFVEDFEHRGWATVGEMLDDGYTLYYVTPEGRCFSVRDRTAIGLVTKERKSLSKSHNFVAVRSGDFDRIFKAWASNR